MNPGRPPFWRRPLPGSPGRVPRDTNVCYKTSVRWPGELNRHLPGGFRDYFSSEGRKNEA
jgi:hypothetical protein